MSKARIISTEHQEKGSARKPSDTLDRRVEDVEPATNFKPGRDEGKIKPAARADGKRT